jgi:hypothetical protein
LFATRREREQGVIDVVSIKSGFEVEWSEQPESIMISTSMDSLVAWNATALVAVEEVEVSVLVVVGFCWVRFSCCFHLLAKFFRF